MKRTFKSGNVVVITGAAQGIGAATAAALIAKGARVALLDRDGDLVAERAAELGPSAAPYVVDVTNRDALETVFAEVAKRWGRIDGVIANAGIAGPVAAIAEADPDAVERVVEIDLLGVMRTAYAAMPYLLESRGHVLLVASIAAAIPCPMFAAYGAAKAGVEAYGRALRIELARSGVTVGVAYFGLIDTGLARDDLLGTGPFASIQGRLPGVLTIAPVGAAAGALVRGVERRSARVWAPSWVPFVLASRSVLALGDGLMSRVPALTMASAPNPQPSNKQVTEANS
ncbi:MAG: SDR family NAD(P)-dependent oxidoreductase [Candidatus Nanopelagicales bacterium]|uniref:SDR family NAD(P)-dependent oxidoreductase n=1 Tax=Nocardioides sp. LML1-1-1.1 TaxID=3135248 RepID=UPI00342F2DAC